MSRNAFINATATFLNYLESGEELCTPYLMHRIKDLLIQRLKDNDTQKTRKAEETTNGSVIHEVWSGSGDEWEEDTFNQDKTILCKFREAIRSMEAKKEPIYVDIQCLLTVNGEYLIKEFCAECSDGPPAWITVKSPPDAIPNTRENQYLKDYINGLVWDVGVIDVYQLSDLTFTLFTSGRRIYIKGMSKITILLKYLKGLHRHNIFDLKNLPKLQEMRNRIPLTEECPFHEHLKTSLACTKKHTRAMIQFSNSQL